MSHIFAAHTEDIVFLFIVFGFFAFGMLFLAFTDFAFYIIFGWSWLRVLEKKLFGMSL